jgi:hypothetical protein
LRRFVGATTRLLLVTVVVGGAIRIGRTLLQRRPGPPGTGAVRTGSFDTWPAVPLAPGRHRSGESSGD